MQAQHDEVCMLTAALPRTHAPPMMAASQCDLPTDVHPGEAATSERGHEASVLSLQLWSGAAFTASLSGVEQASSGGRR